MKLNELTALLRQERLQAAPGVTKAAYAEMRRLVEQLYPIDQQHREALTERGSVLTRMKGMAAECSDVDIVISTPGFGRRPRPCS